MGIVSRLYKEYGFNIITLESKGWICLDCIKPP
jgi:hypothetical protein